MLHHIHMGVMAVMEVMVMQQKLMDRMVDIPKCTSRHPEVVTIIDAILHCTKKKVRCIFKNLNQTV